ncbi:hypothetical protein H8356DRAFT_1275797 [Neocallimastix lanati (nom. inval.)]|jgi:cell fate (sporulation/competence/biofilm development) regulator YlbF (YheA/YmcA/DUF963 family)|uniref:SGF29 C-terminal domain-containing protein n=1 Tax=Neocallimastix californiae TaxID=1754190 RepID=A0A1Y2DZE7_9FUNG|nr:hypothetical protein H8356DRAFT_1275797 [Neocallimastix sp. JGI-2020a]ORY64662.1 hypothetical protein LY90DRAFT_380384 [Neocallimastix californiae]|eukprot:ORY64662.1 hypothetical protein LY90DRAFT_380384 [Neocallimastix californiae]
MYSGEDLNEHSGNLSLSSATPKDITQELILWNQVCQGLLNLYNLNKDVEAMVKKTNKYHERIFMKPELLSPKVAKKLIESYSRVIEKATKEQREINKTEANLEILISLQNAFDTDLNNKGIEHTQKKRKMDKYANSSKSKSHDNKQYKPLSPGNLVVVKPPGQDWLLATVIQYFPDKNKYEVEDIEDDEDKPGVKKHYIFPVKCVLEIPNEDNKRPYFPIGHEVLSLYPNSSCFYKATVIKTPNENKNSSDGKPAYIVQFEDDDEAEREVPENRVLDMPPKMKLKEDK